MPVTNDEIVEALLRPIDQALQRQGITPEYLAKKLKQELNATVVKTHYDPKRGEIVYSKKLPAWEIRQRARQDAHRLLNHYPATKHEVSARVGVVDYQDLDEETRAKLREAATEIAKAILESEKEPSE